MGFLWGLIMAFICHTIANIFNNNVYCYIQEQKCEDKNDYAIKKYLITSLITVAVYIVIFLIALLAQPFADYRAGILIGNGLGFITGTIHFKLMAEANYDKQKAKNEWNAWNYKSYEEKRKTINQTHTVYEKRFLKNGQYDISEFIKEEQLYGRLEDIKIIVGKSTESKYNKGDNNIYISSSDNENKYRFINALLRCFQQAVCVETGILHSQTDFGKDDTDITDDDLFDGIDENAKTFMEKLQKTKNWLYDMTNNMSPQRFFEIQHDLPGFGFPCESEKIDPENTFKAIEEKQKNGMMLTSDERAKLIFADIFASFGHEVDLDKAELETRKFLIDMNNKKPEDISDNKVFLSWFKEWQMPHVLLGTIFAYKKDYIKAAYHLMLGFDGGLMLGGLTLKEPYEGFIKYVFKQLENYPAEKANYSGCGFSADNPMGAYNQVGKVSLWSLNAIYIISRMQGLNGEVIIAHRSGYNFMGYLERQGSCGQPQGLTGIIDKYKTWIIDKDYNLKTIEIFFNGYFEEKNMFKEFKTNCKIAEGFTIKRTCINDSQFFYVDKNLNPLNGNEAITKL